MQSSVLDLCLITQCRHDSLNQYLSFLEQAILGGITSVQLRDKASSLSELRLLAIALKSFLKTFKIPLIINDHVELAAEIDADGVHIGASDLSPLQTRKILGPDKIIGYSVESMTSLQHANQLECIDYIAASAVFPSKNKTDCKTIWGLKGLRELSNKSLHPVVAIGGINISNIKDVIKNGADGVAVIGAIHDHPNPQQVAQQLIQNIHKGTSYVP